jgi:hypothetical protein
MFKHLINKALFCTKYYSKFLGYAKYLLHLSCRSLTYFTVRGRIVKNRNIDFYYN